MEKYYRVSDVNKILNKLAKEPAYYHDGEDFYSGVCAVEGELMCLDTTELEEPKVGTWEKHTYMTTSDYVIKCSVCSESFERKSYQSFYNYCPSCGAKMME